jgi:hypothetical protein
MLKVLGIVIATLLFFGHVAGSYATDDVTLALKPGTYRGEWKQTMQGELYRGEFVLTVRTDAASVRFGNTSCSGEKMLPVVMESGALVLHSPFEFDIGGKCGPARATFTMDGDTWEVQFYRINHKDQFTAWARIPGSGG